MPHAPQSGHTVKRNACQKETHFMLYELRHYDTLTDRDLLLLNALFETDILPAWARAGIEAVGFWTVLVGPQSPRLTCILRWRDNAERDAKWGAFSQQTPALTLPAPAHTVTNTLLRPLPGSHDARRDNQPSRLAGGVFEWRVLTVTDTARFAEWLETGGYAHFARHQMHLMGTWETTVGVAPRVSYMTVFENLAHRERAWAAFYTDPAWAVLEEGLYPDMGPLITHTESCLMKGTEFSGWR